MTPITDRLREAIDDEGRAYILDRCQYYDLLVDAHAALVAALTPTPTRTEDDSTLSLSIANDPLAISEMLDDSTREREMYHRLVLDIRHALGDDGLHAQLLDLPKLIADKLAASSLPAVPGPQEDARAEGPTTDQSSPAPAAGSAWQPIETVPKGEDYILLLYPDGSDFGGWISQTDQGADYEGQSCAPSAGWWNIIGGHEGEPTHWQPLPQPPLAGVVPSTETQNEEM